MTSIETSFLPPKNKIKSEFRSEILLTSPEGDKHLSLNHFSDDHVSEVCLLLGPAGTRPVQTIFSLRTIKTPGQPDCQLITLHTLIALGFFRSVISKVHYSPSGIPKVKGSEVVLDSPQNLARINSTLYRLEDLPPLIDFASTKNLFQEQVLQGIFTTPILVPASTP